MLGEVDETVGVALETVVVGGGVETAPFVTDLFESIEFVADEINQIPPPIPLITKTPATAIVASQVVLLFGFATLSTNNGAIGKCCSDAV